MQAWPGSRGGQAATSGTLASGGLTPAGRWYLGSRAFARFHVTGEGSASRCRPFVPQSALTSSRLTASHPSTPSSSDHQLPGQGVMQGPAIETATGRLRRRQRPVSPRRHGSAVLPYLHLGTGYDPPDDWQCQNVASLRSEFLAALHGDKRLANSNRSTNQARKDVNARSHPRRRRGVSRRVAPQEQAPW